jgi:hypothetical protein
MQQLLSRSPNDHAIHAYNVELICYFEGSTGLEDWTLRPVDGTHRKASLKNNEGSPTIPIMTYSSRSSYHGKLATKSRLTAS